ncbi:MAG: hypothetical protein WAR83_04635 [Flavobacteriales bacterium]|nr:hypothetical protein [Flavobacteriales bacterium]
MLKAILNALCLTVLFVLCAFGQASANHSDGDNDRQDHTYVVLRKSIAFTGIEFRSDASTHGIRQGAAIIAEVETTEEDEHRVEPSTVHHQKHCYSVANGDRSGVSARRSAMLNASVHPAYLAAAPPAFVRFQVFRI